MDIREKIKKLVINPKEDEIIRLIYETCITTCFLFKAYAELKHREIKDRQGKSFSKSAIHCILRNIVRTEMLNCPGKIYQGIHQPIIFEKLFSFAQEI
ncbi:MAG: recombinase family protein [bacterium JZ-2024 1]